MKIDMWAQDLVEYMDSVGGPAAVLAIDIEIPLGERTSMVIQFMGQTFNYPAGWRYVAKFPGYGLLFGPDCSSIGGAKGAARKRATRIILNESNLSANERLALMLPETWAWRTVEK